MRFSKAFPVPPDGFSDGATIFTTGMRGRVIGVEKPTRTSGSSGRSFPAGSVRACAPFTLAEREGQTKSTVRANSSGASVGRCAILDDSRKHTAHLHVELLDWHIGYGESCRELPGLQPRRPHRPSLARIQFASARTRTRCRVWNRLGNSFPRGEGP